MITLFGILEYAYQRDAAPRTVEYLTGLKGITNKITLQQKVEPKNVQEKIIKAFEGSVIIDAIGITVKVVVHVVKLTGKVAQLQKMKKLKK